MTIWKLNSLGSLHWRRWDNEWAIFDVGSGQTYQMDTLTAITLMMLDGEAFDLPRLLDHIADELLMQNNPELSIAVTAVLGQLAAAGLIEPVAA